MNSKINEEQNLRKGAKSLYIFLITIDEKEKICQDDAITFF